MLFTYFQFKFSTDFFHVFLVFILFFMAGFVSIKLIVPFFFGDCVPYMWTTLEIIKFIRLKSIKLGQNSKKISPNHLLSIVYNLAIRGRSMMSIRKSIMLIYSSMVQTECVCLWFRQLTFVIIIVKLFIICVLDWANTLRKNGYFRLLPQC